VILINRFSPVFFEVRPNETTNKKPNGKLINPNGPPKTTPVERKNMRNNKGLIGVTPPGVGSERVDING